MPPPPRLGGASMEVSAMAKVWKVGECGAPKFAADYEIVRRAVLQATDIKSNHNKYYALELHAARDNSGDPFRLYTHYGRTDDLQTNPEGGQKECRYFDALDAALAEYTTIYRQKTSAAKGYHEVSLASCKIGSERARGQSVGEVDAATLARLAKTTPARPSTLSPGLARLVSYLYREATGALTSTVAATITAQGIETPLGVLTLGQIDKGEAILHELYELFQKKTARRSRLVDLSGEFYSAIPHRLGRTRDAIDAAVIDSMEAFEQKQETLQLMKDMLLVNGESGRVLFDSDLEAKYRALRCRVEVLEAGSPGFRQVASFVERSQLRTKGIQVKSVAAVRREGEREAYREGLVNERQLFHGSRTRNWVGILTRGIVLPKIAVSLGVARTDAGWLGNGIYFGDTACTAAFYTTPGQGGSRFMAVSTVGLGRIRDYTKITYGLTAPPAGFDSCHGVRARAGVVSQFADDEFVVYDPRQQRLDYLVEFTA
ncbi:MAG: WGR domain-containing protein [Myxococcales bacterium]|nr:MAG: WGR domain-containing protein [Myxococcales bacterium]